MPIVKVRENEPFDVALRRFKRSCEKAGVLSGLTRVRSMAQDDAHIFCTSEQIGDEITDLFEMVQKVYKTFSFEDLSITLSTRPIKALGDINLWDKAESSLKAVLDNSSFYFTIDKGDEYKCPYCPKIFDKQNTNNFSLVA